MKFFFSQSDPLRAKSSSVHALKAKKLTGQSVETHTSKSFDAARKMAQAKADNHQERKAYSAALVKESRDLSDYIVTKRVSAPKKIAS